MVSSGTTDARRTAKRWSVAILVFTIAAMAVIRTASVRHRSLERERSLMAGGEQLGGATGGAEDRTDGRPGADVSYLLEYTICAGNEIHIGGSGGAGSLVVGDIHNNARRGGAILIDGTSDVYGRVTSAGAIAIGSSDGGGPTVLYGSARGEKIAIGELGEVRHFEDLNEWVHGVDFDRDGTVEDMNVTKSPAVVQASREILSGGETLIAGDTDPRIADGTQPVEIKTAPPRTVAPPQPDFRVYYEMTTGTSAYPPVEDHVASEIPGDGQGHYFASAQTFLGWINSQQQRDVLCWRCAGDGKIDPGSSTDCAACASTGETPAVEITGVFYVDDERLDLSRIETNLVVHGTIVVADGNPHDWPRRQAGAPGGASSNLRFPRQGSLTIGGAMRMNFTQTYRCDQERGAYIWRHRSIHTGSDQQYIPVPVPEEGRAMRGFPAIAAAGDIAVLPRAAGFASYAGDSGDEAVTVLQGVVFAGGEVRVGGRGGWHGDAIVFDEEELRAEDETLDESVLRIDLNDDGDVFDLLKIADITARQVIRVKKGRYTIDVNNDGVLGKAVIGEDYGEFFAQNGYAPPVLFYHEGTILAETIRIDGQSAVLFDPLVAGSAPIVGFGGSTGDRIVSQDVTKD